MPQLHARLVVELHGRAVPGLDLGVAGPAPGWPVAGVAADGQVPSVR
jgi:hypothetical protein